MRPSLLVSLLRLVVVAALVAAFATLAPIAPATAAVPSGCTLSGATISCSYGYTGAPASLVLPAPVTSVSVVATGAPGAFDARYSPPDPGRGARVTTTLAVTGGSTLQIRVGESGKMNMMTVRTFGGGGAGLGSGGGASDVRVGAFGLSDRVVVAGGGGGVAGGAYIAGDGGDPDGHMGPNTGVGKGGGGTQTAGGTAGPPYTGCETPAIAAQPGSFGLGGNGGWCKASGTFGAAPGGGGGGGWYGGGGGLDLSSGVGGGGSSYAAPTLTSGTTYVLVPRTTPGSVVISWTLTPQTVTFTGPTRLLPGATVPIEATGGGSGNAIVFASTTPAVCTVSGSDVTYVADGTCTVTGDQAGNDLYAAAPQATWSFPAGPIPQAITWSPPTTGTALETVTLTATGGGSGKPVVIASTTPSVCTVSGLDVTYLIAGTCTLTADQAGTTTYAPAPQRVASIAVGLAPQAITWGPPAAGTALETVAITATGGGSGNPVVIDSTTPSVCTVSGLNVTYLIAGTCTLTADQAGTATYGAAPQQVANIAVGLAPQAITWSPPATGTALETVAITATGGGSGNPVMIASTTPSVCTVSGLDVTYLTSGTCSLTADQDGNATYAAAPQLTASISVGLVPQVISWDPPATGTALQKATINASGGGSGNPVVIASTTPTVCTVSGSEVTYLIAGTCSLTASQAGTDGLYAAAEQSTDITVALAPQAITWNPPATGTALQTATITATGGGSGNPVVIASTTPAVCTVSGFKVSYLIAGTCTITANQSGGPAQPLGRVAGTARFAMAVGDVYAAAPQLTAAITVARVVPDVTIGGIPDTAVAPGTTTLPATGPHGEHLTYRSKTPNVCRVVGNTVRFIAAGKCQITAQHAATSVYAATTTQLTITVTAHDSGSSDGLPETGTTALSTTAMGLLFVGVGLLMLGRPRRARVRR